jgi:hypothetical protein
MADEIQLKITADDAASPVLEAVAEEAEELAGAEVEVAVEADTGTAEDDVAAVTDALEEVPDSVETAVEADTGTAEADVGAVTDALEDVPDSVDTAVEADTGSAEADVEAVSDALENVDGQTATAAVEVDTEGAKGSLDELTGMLEGLPGPAGAAGKALGGLTGGNLALAGSLGGIAAAGAAAVGMFTDLAGEVRNFQRIAGTSAEESSAFVAVLDDYAISADAGATAIQRMARNAETAPQKFAEFGVEVARNKDGNVDLEATLLNVAEAYANTEDQATKAALGAGLMGKGYTTLIPILEKGADGADGLQAALEGVEGQQILSQEQLDQAEEYRLALDRLGDAAKEVALLLGSTLVPVLTDLADIASVVTESANTLLGPIDGLGGVFKTFVSPLPNAINNLERLGDAITGSTNLMEGAPGAVARMTLALAEQAIVIEDLVDEQEAWALVSESVVEASDAVTTASELVAEAVLAEAEAQREAQEAAEERADAQRAAADATFAVHKAESDWLDTLDELPGKIDAITSSGRTQEQQTRDLQNLMIDQVGVATDLADADVKLAEEQAAAAGTTLDQAEKTSIWNDRMLDAARNAEGPLRDALIAYIAKVNEIPEERVAEILATDNGTIDAVATEADKAAENRDSVINFTEVGLRELERRVDDLATVTAGNAPRTATMGLVPWRVTAPVTVNIYAPGGVYGDAGIRQLAAVVTDEVAVRLASGLRPGGGGRP